MKIIIKHILRNIWSKKGRSILIIIASIIAATTFTLNLILPNEILFKIEETYRKVFGDVDIRIRLSNQELSLDDVYLGNEKINYSVISQLDGTDDEGNLIVLYGTNFQNGKKMKFISSSLNNLNNNEAIISEKYADKYKVGDKINFYYNEKYYEITIAEIVDKKGLNALETDEATTMVTNLETLQIINNNEKIDDSALYIDVLNDDNINNYLDYLKNNNNADYKIEKILDQDTLKEETAFVSSIMLIMFVMAIIIIFVVISSLNKIIVSERMPVIGTFRSIGATKGKMNTILILENAMYGLVGGLIGTLLAYLINSKVSVLFISSNGIELSKQTSTISITNILIGILFAVLLEILMTISSIIKANKKSIKDIIFDVQSTKYIYKRKDVIIGILSILMTVIIVKVNTDNNNILTIIALSLSLLGIYNLIPIIIKLFSYILTKIFKIIGLKTTRIASKNISYNQMIISSAKTIVIALTLIISILNVSKVISNMFDSFKYVYFDVYDKSIMVYNLSQDKEQYDKLLAKEYVEDIHYVYHYYDDNVTYQNGKSFSHVPLFVTAEEVGRDIKELNYKIKDLKNNEILIDEKYLEKNGININDVIKIKFDLINKEIEFKVVGTINSLYYTSTRNVIFVNFDYYVKNITAFPAQMVVITKNQNLEKWKNDIKEELKEPFIKIKTFDEYLYDQKKDVDSIINLIYVIVGLAIALAFVGIINNQIIGFMQRKREIAILNSTCMSKSQIKKMLFEETILTNIFSCFIAVIASYFMTNIIASFLQGMSMYFEMTYDWQNALNFIVIIFIVLLLTLIVPSRKINKMNIVEEIKYE